MSNIRFSQLPTAVSLTDDDLFAISSVDTSTTPTTYTSVKSPISQVAAKIVEDTTFSTSLPTTNKTVAGAISETLGNFANNYDATSTYAVGDCVLYAGGLYKCNTAIAVAEAWTPAHWTAIKAVDVGGGGNRTYSTTEHIIGTWINGSDLYEITVVINPLVKDGTDQYVNHGVNNINLVLGYESFFSKSSDGRCCDKNTDTTAQYVCSVWEVNRTQIGYSIGAGWDFDYAYVTIRYTKSS